TTMLGELNANILEVSHSRLFLNVSAKGVYIDITVEVRDGLHARSVFEKLKAASLNVIRIESGEAGF
ncbi:MAG: threonine ammonia-lyase, partial [Pseudomonadota bacterium]